MNRKERKSPWILPYRLRKSVSKKFRDTEKKIKQCKAIGNWDCVKRLKYILRNAWWGIKRYKNK